MYGETAAEVDLNARKCVDRFIHLSTVSTVFSVVRFYIPVYWKLYRRGNYVNGHVSSTVAQHTAYHTSKNTSRIEDGLVLTLHIV